MENGANILLFNTSNSPGSIKVNHDVDPVWRSVLMFAAPLANGNVADAAFNVMSLSRDDSEIQRGKPLRWKVVNMSTSGNDVSSTVSSTA